MSISSLLDTKQESEGYGLGRLYLPDPDDHAFLMRNTLVEADPVSLPLYRYYLTGPVLNQGNTPRCVEFSWNGWLLSSPLRNKSIDPVGTLYCEAQALDPWDGDCSNPKYDGSTVRAGAKALQARGLVDTYVWAFTTPDIANWLLSGKGPVVFGTRWFRSMQTPDAKGVLHVDVNSPLDGGHAYLCIGYNSKTRMFRFLNSWGTGWGQNGRFWMSADDVELLLQRQGEACTAIEVKA